MSSPDSVANPAKHHWPGRSDRLASPDCLEVITHMIPREGLRRRPRAGRKSKFALSVLAALLPHLVQQDRSVTIFAGHVDPVR